MAGELVDGELDEVILGRCDLALGERLTVSIVRRRSFDYPAFYALAFESGQPVQAIRKAAGGATSMSGRSGRPADRAVDRRNMGVGVIGLLAAGRINGEIALELGVTVRTVESHLRRLLLGMAYSAVRSSRCLRFARAGCRFRDAYTG